MISTASTPADQKVTEPPTESRMRSPRSGDKSVRIGKERDLAQLEAAPKPQGPSSSQGNIALVSNNFEKLAP